MCPAGSAFQRADLRSLQVCAPSVIERRCPGLIDAMAAKGWAPPPRIDRVYDCSLAMRELGYRPHGLDLALRQVHDAWLRRDLAGPPTP